MFEKLKALYKQAKDKLMPKTPHPVPAPDHTPAVHGFQGPYAVAKSVDEARYIYSKTGSTTVVQTLGQNKVDNALVQAAFVDSSPATLANFDETKVSVEVKDSVVAYLAFKAAKQGK